MQKVEQLPDIDLYRLGSSDPVGKVTFTEEQMVSPEQITNDKIDPVARRHIRDTFFANVFRKYMHQRSFDFDPEMLDNFRSLLVTHIERATAIQMTQADLKASIKETGIAIEADEKLFELSASMLELKFIDESIDIFGLNTYKDEIMLRELDTKFGSASTLASERRQHKRKAEDRENWYHTTVASMHNMMRELLTVTREGAGLPAPASPFIRKGRKLAEAKQYKQTDLMDELQESRPITED